MDWADKVFIGFMALAVLAVLALFGMGVVTFMTRGDPRTPIYYIDALTGCEYIAADESAQLVPRVDARGRHICGGEE